MPSQEERRERLTKLMAEYMIDLGDNSYSGPEDLREFFPETSEEPEEIGPYAVVTRTGDLTYIYPDYEDLEGAQDKATINIDDGIYAETPECVVALDTGERWYPDWSNVPWRTLTKEAT